MPCLQCSSSERTALGRLGYLNWFRCRACGWDYSTGRKPTPRVGKCILEQAIDGLTVRVFRYTDNGELKARVFGVGPHSASFYGGSIPATVQSFIDGALSALKVGAV